MDVPTFLPSNLSYCETCKTEQELVQALTQKPSDAVEFFELACEDETWCESHGNSVRALLRWGAKTYYLNQLPHYLAKRMVKSIQMHYTMLQAWLYFHPALFFTVDLQVEQEVVTVNSLLFGVCSSFFNETFRQQCFEHLRNDWVLEQGARSLFRLVEEHINQGEIRDLWRHEQEEVLALMYQARLWDLPDLVKECALILRRYINRENVLETLLRAHQQYFKEWKLACYEFFNRLELGLRVVETSDITDLKVAILDFKENTLEIFQRLSPFATHLAFSGHLSEEPLFSSLLLQCPKLKGVDLRESLAYVNQFEKTPSHLTELDLSACSWLDSHHLQQASQSFPKLKRLNLANNGQLNYLSWGALNRFPYLIELQLSRCHQLTDEDIQLISRCCPQLVKLNIEECRSLTNYGVIEIVHECRKLNYLNLSHCTNITDRALKEIAVQSDQLSHLSIVKCSNLSNKGLLELLRLRTSLRWLELSFSDFSPQTIDWIKRQYPLLVLENVE